MDDDDMVHDEPVLGSHGSSGVLGIQTWVCISDPDDDHNDEEEDNEVLEEDNEVLVEEDSEVLEEDDDV